MDKFNLYIDKIDLNFWRELCTKEGKLRSYKKGEYFLHRGEITRYVWGFIKQGYFKYSVINLLFKVNLRLFLKYEELRCVICFLEQVVWSNGDF